MNFLKSTALARSRRRLNVYWAGDKLFILLSSDLMHNPHLGERECWVLGCILELRLEILRRETGNCGFR